MAVLHKDTPPEVLSLSFKMKKILYNSGGCGYVGNTLVLSKRLWSLWVTLFFKVIHKLHGRGISTSPTILTITSWNKRYYSRIKSLNLL